MKPTKDTVSRRHFQLRSVSVPIRIAAVCMGDIEDSRASLLINKSPFICRRPPGAAAGAEAASRGGALPPRGDSRRFRVLAKG